MKRAAKQGSGVYAYLQATGVLAKGTPIDIEQAKRQYWREQKAAWRKKQRSEQKSYEVFLTPAEHKTLQQKSKNLHISITRFIKQAALSSDGKLANPIVIGEVREKLFLHYNAVQTLLEEEKIAKPIGVTLLRQVVELESMIMHVLR